ncbi:hypothetical protein OAG71_01510 [bacterium]|nr:hypothetical protein [bacterium]
MRILCSLFSILIFAALSNQSLAQPLGGRTHYSVESLISPAVFVAIGSIKRVDENVITEPRHPHDRGEVEYVIETQFDEILKRVNDVGEAGEFETFTTTGLSAGRNEWLAKWARDKTVGLWLIEPKYETEDFHRWQFIPFDEVGVDYFGHRSLSIKPPMFARDLTILTTSEQILQRIRDYCPTSQAAYDINNPTTAKAGPLPGELHTEMLRELGGPGSVVLPYDSELPKTARRLIESPRDILQAEKTEDSYALHRHREALDKLRSAGVQLLGQIKTESSVELLRQCLDETILPFDNSIGATQVRITAYRQLLAWQDNPPRPKFSDKIETLVFHEDSITDDTLALISEHVNLQKLYLSNANVSHVGVQHLGKLDRLNYLSLDYALLTDEMFRTLQENQQLHIISQATTTALNENGNPRRPNSAEDVTDLELWSAPLTNAGWSKILFYENLTHLFLGRMNITEHGIEQLAQLKKLESLELRETQFTEDGIALLKKLLPNCKIKVWTVIDRRGRYVLR